MSAPWWASAVFYQVYPRSFADGNGDGTGDLIGVRERLPYLRELGVDALWLSPFFRSPMVDGGYDVSDPCDVDPLFGTLADFDALLADAHALGLRVTIDVVPNHLSDQHEWFRDGLRDRFLFRPGRGDGPPNNWVSSFGGPAWTRAVDENGADGSWYLHLFAPEQPDLDWTNPAVHEWYEQVLRFWLDRGVDGFRVDVAHGLAKEPGLPDLPAAVLAALKGGIEMPPNADIRWDRDGVHEHRRLMRSVLNDYDGERMAVAEAWVADPVRLANYVRPDEFNLAFNFELLEEPWDADAFRAAIERSLAALACVGAPATWVLANHDVPRAATRYGSVARARAAALMMLALPGAAYVYQGDELGLADAPLRPAELVDQRPRSRDPVRVPMPWSGATPPFGFSSSARTWLPQPASWRALTVEAQAGDPTSTMELYRAALRLRRSFVDADFALLDAPQGCLAFRRGDVSVLLNAGISPAPLPAGEILLASSALTGTLPPDTAVWVSARRS